MRNSNLIENRLKKISLNLQLKELQRTNSDILESDSCLCEGLSVGECTPKSRFPDIIAEVLGLTTKTWSQHFSKPSFRRCYINITHAHSGCASTLMALQKEMGGGVWGVCVSGVFICYPDYTTSFCLPAGDKNSNYRAELRALAAASEPRARRGQPTQVHGFPSRPAVSSSVAGFRTCRSPNHKTL